MGLATNFNLLKSKLNAQRWGGWGVRGSENGCVHAQYISLKNQVIYVCMYAWMHGCMDVCLYI